MAQNSTSSCTTTYAYMPPPDNTNVSSTVEICEYSPVGVQDLIVTNIDNIILLGGFFLFIVTMSAWFKILRFKK